MSDINNKYLNTTSLKFKKISMLLIYVHRKIIENQNVRRLVYYNSRNPLSSKGLTYAGNKVHQPDLTEKDVKDLIMMLPFNPDMKIATCNSIFINIPQCTFGGDTNRIYVDVDIVSPIEYFEITTGIRPYEIANEIANIFDSLCVEDESYELGNSRFTLQDTIVRRLSNSSNMVYVSMRFKTDILPFNKTRG